jgi:protein SCO1
MVIQSLLCDYTRTPAEPRRGGTAGAGTGRHRPAPSPTLTQMPRGLRLAPLALAAVVALALAVVAIVTGSSGHGSPPSSRSSPSSSQRASSGPESGFEGAALPGSVIAPNFTLSNQYGDAVSLSEYRGQVVVLTFLYSTCGAACIVIAQQIRGALNELRGGVPVLIVSADPAADSRANVARFLSEVSLSGRVQYLTGPLWRLREVWAAYGIKPASVGASEFDEYASVLLLDRAGRERVLFQSEQLTPESLSHDIGKLQAG